MPGEFLASELCAENDFGSGTDMLEPTVTQWKIQVGDLHIGHGEPDLGAVDRIDASQCRTAGHVLTKIDLLTAHPASEWCLQHGPFKIQRSFLQCGFS